MSPHGRAIGEWAESVACALWPSLTLFGEGDRRDYAGADGTFSDDGCMAQIKGDRKITDRVFQEYAKRNGTGEDRWSNHGMPGDEWRPSPMCAYWYLFVGPDVAVKVSFHILAARISGLKMVPERINSTAIGWFHPIRVLASIPGVEVRPHTQYPSGFTPPPPGRVRLSGFPRWSEQGE